MELSHMQEPLDKLAGKPVTQKIIAGNSIEIYLGLAPMEERAQVIWVEPPWRLEQSGHIISTSADFPWEPEEGETEKAFRARFEDVCSASDGLKKATLISARLDPITSDLELSFGGELTLRTFTVWRDESWHFRDYGQNKRYRVSLSGVEIEPIDQTGDDA